MTLDPQPQTEQTSESLSIDADDLTTIELNLATAESRVRAFRSGSKNFAIASGVLTFGAISFAIFGSGIVKNAQMIGLVAAAYAVLFGGSLIFITFLKISSLQQEIDVLLAKKRILTRSANFAATATDQALSYFDRLVDLNITNLGAYYGLVKIHTNNSFFVSIAAGGIGFALIITGVALGFTGSSNAPTIAIVSSASGVITEFIASVFFYLYNRTVRQMKEYHDSLIAVQNVLLAFKIVGDTRDEKEKTKMVGQMLAYLVRRQAPTTTPGEIQLHDKEKAPSKRRKVAE